MLLKNLTNNKTLVRKKSHIADQNLASVKNTCKVYINFEFFDLEKFNVKNYLGSFSESGGDIEGVSSSGNGLVFFRGYHQSLSLAKYMSNWSVKEVQEFLFFSFLIFSWARKIGLKPESRNILSAQDVDGTTLNYYTVDELMKDGFTRGKAILIFQEVQKLSFFYKLMFNIKGSNS